MLSEVAKISQDIFRASDIVCRYGGEEFVSILTNTTSDEAEVVCERFRKSIESHVFEHETFKIEVTVSIGIAPYESSKYESKLDFLGAADTALYEAKKAGRNCVVLASRQEN
ncbi:GGDEF domain-containing protein [bacterium AH-315-P07]|nr:GGDEF domain-containing protein [bacterium AH-315-P07]